MQSVKRFILLFGMIVFVTGCSAITDVIDEFTGGGGDNSSESMTDEEAAIKEFEEEMGIDLDEIEDEMGIDKSDDADIPADIPSDVPLPDDMEIEMVIDNELMSQVWINTSMSTEELMAMYEDYLNSSNNFSGAPTDEDYEVEGYYTITYTIAYGDGEFYVQIIDDEDDGDVSTLTLSVM